MKRLLFAHDYPRPHSLSDSSRSKLYLLASASSKSRMVQHRRICVWHSRNSFPIRSLRLRSHPNFPFSSETCFLVPMAYTTVYHCGHSVQSQTVSCPRAPRPKLRNPQPHLVVTHLQILLQRLQPPLVLVLPRPTLALQLPHKLRQPQGHPRQGKLPQDLQPPPL